MKQNDVQSRADIQQIIKSFYDALLDDPIVGFIFTDIAKIDLASHIPIVVDFWQDIVLAQTAESGFANEKCYSGNTLQVHLDLHLKIPLRAGHFTRWLYLFNITIDANFAGENAERMKQRAEMVAKSISAAISKQKKAHMELVLPKKAN